MSAACGLSLVVCTRNRAPQLAECLAALERLEPVPGWELLVIDNASDDETPTVLAQYSGSLPLRAIHEPRVGIGVARNTGWRASCGELVAFTDDDCYPHPDFLREIVAAFGESDTIGFVGGPVILHDPRHVRMSIKESLVHERFPAGTFIPPGAIHGANFAFRRVTLERINGFDEMFGAGAPFVSAEDTDALGRALSAGWSGVYTPRIVVTHNHGREGGPEVVKLARHYSRGRGAYYAKALLDSQRRTTYARHWYWAVRRQPWRNSAREMAAGLEYLVRRLTHRHVRS